MHKKAELIFMKWKAELVDMDRSKPAVEGNFDLLWSQFDSAKVPMETGLEYLDKATKAHYPSDFMIKRTYQKRKRQIPQSMQEFEKSWKDFIADTAKRVFFCYFEIEGVEQKDTKVGGMSRSEYVKLQRYADSHETIDWEALIKEKEQFEAEDEDDGPDIDLDKVDINIDLGGL